MNTKELSAELNTTLIEAVEINIDMSNDLVLDSVWYSVKKIREMAVLPDEELKKLLADNIKSANEGVDQLVNLQILLIQLKE